MLYTVHNSTSLPIFFFFFHRMTENILTSSSDLPIRAYDSLTGETLAQFCGSRSPRQGLSLAGNKLIAASHVSPDSASSGFIHLYNWWSSAVSHSIHVPEPVAPIVSTSDGAYLFSGGLSGQIYAMSLPSGNLCRSFQAHRQPVSCMAISQDGSLLISGGDDGVISVFPILRILDHSLDGSESSGWVELALYQFDAHSSAVTCVANGPGGCNSTIVSSSVDETCKFWSIADGTHLQTVILQCPVWCIAVDPTNSAVYAGGSDGQVHVILPTKRGVEVATWEAEPTGAVTVVAMVNGNKNLVAASEEGIIRFWEVETGSIIRAFRQERGAGVSHLLVINGFNGGQTEDEVTRNSGLTRGFSEKELCSQAREVEEMKEWLDVVVKDRRRALDKLEVSMKNYKILLQLLLKEAKHCEGNKKDS